MEELALLEGGRGEEGNRRRRAFVLLRFLVLQWLLLAIDLHPSLLILIVGRGIDHLALVLVRHEVVLPLVLELAHALLVDSRAVGGGGSGGRLGRLVPSWG